jgi:hypothetical protein
MITISIEDNLLSDGSDTYDVIITDIDTGDKIVLHAVHEQAAIHLSRTVADAILDSTTDDALLRR